jgi:hypothetical protein
MSDTEKLNKIRDASLEAADLVTRAYSPQWKARMDVAKALVPIASAAVIFSVAFAGSFAKPSVHIGWRLCLAFSWFCFLAALTSSLLSLWFAIGLHDAQANVLEQSDKLRTAIAKPNVTVDEMLAVMDDIFLTANKPIERRDKASRRLLNAAYVFYGLAIWLIGVLGVRLLVGF